MTRSDPVEHLFQELSGDDTQQQQQQQQKPFHIVLVDIEKAAQAEIHCVEKPLEGDTEEIAGFVALSYRWGELEEQLIDTRLGYIASITSFALYHFYQLCALMMKEPDFKSIKYVWVDAICVEQTNHERRKATMRQMSNIYERATYILAVPNLHKQHLWDVSQSNISVILKLEKYHEYIYYLLQGNSDKVVQLDNAFLDKIGVPRDQVLRQLVTTYSHCFMDELALLGDSPYNFDPDIVAEELYNTSQLSSLTNQQHNADATRKNQTQTDLYTTFGDLFHRSHEVKLAENWKSRFVWHGKRNKDGHPTLPWNNYVIRRNNDIAQAMGFLKNLILDWSSRVWVISEYHIAKKKNNLKYWFLGFSSYRLAGLPFFKFDFGGSALSHGMNRAIYKRFHETMIKQLETRTFFEKILSSKASKHEDRFYAILPQTKYKDKINQVADWNIDTMISVKLKLFEIMDTKDKLILFFLIGICGFSITSLQILPTFATLAIGTYKDDIFYKDYPLNFDMLNNKSTITLHHRFHDSQPYHYLQLTPKGYFVARKPYNQRFLPYANLRKEMLCSHFQLDEHSLGIEFVQLNFFDKNEMSGLEAVLCSYFKIYLAGSFFENKWILCFRECLDNEALAWSYNNNNDAAAIVFNIY